MIARKAIALLLPFALCLLLSICAHAQSQTTGRIAGTVKDENGAVIVGAELIVLSCATRDGRKAITDPEGNYVVSLLPPGTYTVSVTASGFKTAQFDSVAVAITETTSINANLAVGGAIQESVTVNAASLIQT